MQVRNIVIAILVILVVWGWARPAKVVERDVFNNEIDFGSMGQVFKAIYRRGSTKMADFSADAPSEQELRLLGWAATGRNRDGKSGFTVPLAMGVDPYVNVYLLDSNSVQQFDIAKNNWVKIAGTDKRAQVVKMEAAGKVPALMIFVGVPSNLPVMIPDSNYLHVATGAMAQNVYLLASELGVQTRYISSIDADGIRQVLALDKEAVPIAAVLLAKDKLSLPAPQATFVESESEMIDNVSRKK